MTSEFFFTISDFIVFGFVVSVSPTLLKITTMAHFTLSMSMSCFGPQKLRDATCIFQSDFRAISASSLDARIALPTDGDRDRDYAGPLDISGGRRLFACPSA